MSDDINCVWYLLVVIYIVLFYYQYNFVLTFVLEKDKKYFSNVCKSCIYMTKSHINECGCVNKNDF